MSLQNLLTDKEKRFILVGGKGGVGKTTTSCAIATRFALEGEKTLIISTDPAHSISDSFDVDLSGGQAIEIKGFNGLLYGMEVNATEAGESFSDVLGISGAEEQVSEFSATLQSLGIEEFGDLVETAPPGLDEAVALAKVIQLLNSDEYKSFTKVVFDTAPTGHTLRLLSLPEFLDSFIVKAMKVRSKIGNLMGTFRAFLSGQQQQKDRSIDVLEEIKKLVLKVKEFFQDSTHTEFAIVTIPTIMAIKESERLYETLKQYNISVKNLIVNQIMPENPACKFCMARASNQQSNLEYIEGSFAGLEVTKIEYFDREIRGIDSLKFMAKYVF